MVVTPDTVTQPRNPAPDDALAAFHPAVADWFRGRLGTPTPVQTAVWPVIARGESVLVAAPTGAGKTLAAWLPVIHRLADGGAGSGLRVVYVSPLRALSRDMVANLSRPLEDLAEDGRIRVPSLGLRTGDTSPAERRGQARCPPEMLVTTPESLYVLLGSVGGRRMLSGVDTVIVDEIHALAGNKRGAHLSLSLERLQALTGRPLQRVGLSATQKPLALMAGFLAGAGGTCRALEPMADRCPDVSLELPDCPLGPFAHGRHWEWIHARLAELSSDHASMLVFCNTRALVERTARALAERLGDEVVAAHHGSLGQERRFEVEQNLRQGRLRLVVTSASLELGLDLGDVDLVCQLGSPGRINLLRQRAGRACHRPGARPKAALFPLTLTDLLDARGLLDALATGDLDSVQIPDGPRDVLCQHLVAMVASGLDDPDELFSVVRRAWPWRALDRDEFEAVVDMLVDGFVPGRGAEAGLIRRSADGRYLAAARDAGRTARVAGGTIPEWFEYRVLHQPGGADLGSLDEEFAFESSPGQIMQLGNRVLRILKITGAAVLVEPAPGETPNVPFWFGDAPGRSNALSGYVQAVLSRHESDASPPEPTDNAGRQLTGYLHTTRSILGMLPGPDRIVVERFFDPGGDQHYVIHAPVGARINRAWGLALRKRFCRQFNFELQAAATENGVLISLGATHSFDLLAPMAYLNADNVREVLTQALLDTPVYLTRFRWCANTALAIPRRGSRGRVPAQLQRNQAENLVARVFPDQLACLENLAGDRRIPDHPLVHQALADCLEDYLDIGGLERLLIRVEQGEIRLHGRDVAEPSPLAAGLIHAPRHAFLDPAGAEERRTRSFEAAARAATPVMSPDGGELADGRRRAWRRVGACADFEQALVAAGYITAGEGETGTSATGVPGRGGWIEAFRSLTRRQAAVSFRPDDVRCFWTSVDRLPELLAIWPDGRIGPPLPEVLQPDPLPDPDEALARLLVRRMSVTGPVPTAFLCTETGLAAGTLEAGLERLRAEGVIMRRDDCWLTRDQARSAGG